MIKIPTNSIIGFVGILFAIKAPIGAAITPPIINPNITDQCVNPMVAIKVKELANATKNKCFFIMNKNSD